jgi:hypothetical protein
VLVSNAGDPLARPPAVQIATKQALAGDSQPHTLQLEAIQPGSGERGLVWSGCIMRPARSSLDCRIALHPDGSAMRCPSGTGFETERRAVRGGFHRCLS